MKKLVPYLYQTLKNGKFYLTAYTCLMKISHEKDFSEAVPVNNIFDKLISMHLDDNNDDDDDKDGDVGHSSGGR